MSCRPTGGRKTRKYESKATGGRVTPASYRALNMYGGSGSGRRVLLLSLENLPGGRSQSCKTTGSCHNQPNKPLVLLISTGSRALCPALLCLRTAECRDSFVTSFFLFLFQFLTLFSFANTLLLILHSAPDSELSITLRFSSLNSDWCSQQSVESTTLFWQVLSFDKNWPLWNLSTCLL